MNKLICILYQTTEEISFFVRYKQDSNLRGNFKVFFKPDSPITRLSQIIADSYDLTTEQNSLIRRCDQCSNIRGKFLFGSKFNVLTTGPSQLEGKRHSSGDFLAAKV